MSKEIISIIGASWLVLGFYVAMCHNVNTLTYQQAVIIRKALEGEQNE